MFQEFTGKQYLKIDIANNFGHDKLLWNERIDWFDAHEAQLMTLLPKAEKPALFYAGIQAWEAMKAGLPSGYPISLDACSSGLQILACLTGDREAAKLCNVVDTGERRDAYTEVYNWMQAELGTASKLRDRDPVKQAVMTSLYGSEAEPKRVFGEGAVLELFYRAMTTLAPGAWELNQAFLGMWDHTAMSYHWTLPDNFHVHTKVIGTTTEEVTFAGAVFEIDQKINAPQKTGRSLGANTTHSVDGYIVRELVRRCNFDPEQLMRVKVSLCAAQDGVADLDDPDTAMVATLWGHYEKTGMLSARIFDYINEDSVHVITDRAAIWKLLYSMPAKPFEVLTIHDAFRVLPNYGNDLRRQYNHLLSEVAKGSLLDHIAEGILGRKVACGKLDDTLWVSVLETNYALS